MKKDKSKVLSKQRKKQTLERNKTNCIVYGDKKLQMNQKRTEKYSIILGGLSSKKFCADSGYRSTFVNNIKNQISLDVDISEKIKPHSWQKNLALGC